MMTLSQLPKTTDKRKKRVGRGYGSGKGGHTSGRGMNGQNSRAGSHLRSTFEGGQTELIHRLPRLRGRHGNNGEATYVITLSMLQNKFKENDTVDYKALVKAGILKEGQKAKILSKGKIEKKITIKGIPMSATAQKAIEQA